MPSILVIDDDPAIALLIRQLVEGAGHNVLAAANGEQAWNKFYAEQPDVVILDLLLPDISGLELFAKLHAHDAKVPVIVLTARGSSSNAIEAMRLGALDFLVKPVDLTDLRRLLGQAFDIRRLMAVPVEIRDAHESAAGGSELLVGRSAAMREIYKMIGRVAARDVTVLVAGETGAGKELVTRAIYHYSQRAKRPFLIIDCRAGESAFETELFGSERRSATERQRVGKIAQCAGGTIVLDEIGRLSAATQSKILRWLQHQQYERPGETQPQTSDVRVIATTSDDLAAAVAAGTFRPDLYYYLQGVQLELPPLRSRLDDLPALCQHFLTLLNRQFEKRVLRIPPETLDCLRRYHWPGNIRELQSVLKQALAQASGALLLVDFLPVELRQPGVAEESPPGGRTTDWTRFFAAELELGTDDVYDHALQEMERHVLTLTLRHTLGNQVKAAKLLGITRGNLRNKMRLLGIVIDRQVGLAEVDDDLGSN